MLGEHHSILKEFANDKDTIIELLKKDLHFASLSSQYHELDNKLVTLEEQGVPISDHEFTQLKMRRAELKDELFRAIKRSNHESK